MKKNSFLPVYIAASVAALLTLSILYLMQSQRAEVENHYRVVLFFEQLHAVANDLDKEVLRSRAFITKDYDTIVGLTNTLRTSCAKLVALAIWDTPEEKRYCDILEEKIGAIERFKSRNSILKNSLQYLPELIIQIKGAAQDEARETYSLLQRFSAEPNKKLRILIEKKISSSTRGGREDTLRLHAENVISSVDEREKLEAVILSGDLNRYLDGLQASYLKRYNQQQNRIALVRGVLLLFCGLMAAMLIFLFHRIQHMKNLLTNANNNLEAKVASRTEELERAMAALAEKQQMLAHSSKMSALGEMAGGVAHEINTPLAVIGLRADQLEECIADGSASKEFTLESLQMIKKTITRIAKIVSGLRTFARDGSALPVELVEIGKIVDDTLALCQERFKSHGVSVEVEKSSALHQSLRCREVEISQVLLNLLNNSFDAIEKNQKKWIKITAQEDASAVAIAVTDSGTGIPEEIRAKIAQPFFTTKEVGKGTGLGLSISRGIIESHGGTLSLDENHPNTRFILTLPLAQNEKKAA